MTSMRRAAPLLAIALGSCGGEKTAVSDSAAIAITSTPIPRPVVTAQPTGIACEHTGLWAACSLERRLKQSGFVVKNLQQSPARAGFSVKPITYSLGSSRLEVFIYDSEKSLQSDMQTIDTLTVAPRGATPAWPSTPVLIRSANLAAVLLTQNQRQAERVALAITAGPPQPGSPR
jgi:hypothetical protein